MSITPPAQRSLAWPHARLALLWALFVAYGSLVPLEYKARPDAWQYFVNTPWLDLGVGSRADWVANILLYLVLAYFVTGAVWASQLTRTLRTLLLALMLGACLALAVAVVVGHTVVIGVRGSDVNVGARCARSSSWSHPSPSSTSSATWLAPTSSWGIQSGTSPDGSNRVGTTPVTHAPE